MTREPITLSEADILSIIKYLDRRLRASSAAAKLAKTEQARIKFLAQDSDFMAFATAELSEAIMRYMSVRAGRLPADQNPFIEPPPEPAP